MDFLYPLRILAGRQLTRREIGLAQEGKRKGAEFSCTIYGTSNSEFTVSHETYCPVISPGISFFGLSRSDGRTYTQDGRLRKRVTDNYLEDTHSETHYDPPGRFVGKAPEEKKAA